PLLASSISISPKRKKITVTLCGRSKHQFTDIFMKKLIVIAIGLIVAQFTSGAWASPEAWFELEQGDKLQLQMSPYTRHRTYNVHRKLYGAIWPQDPSPLRKTRQT
ncbi:MAG: hypothetical protein ACD_23C00078G0005, partial [uncultured bacterium]